VEDDASRSGDRIQRPHISPPKRDFMSLLGQVCGGGIAAMTTTKNSDAHRISFGHLYVSRI
jgi:hypothetical protein